MKRIFVLLIILFSSMNFAFAQESSNYYVSASKLNVRAGTNVESTSLIQLKKYQNIKVIEFVGDWAKVSINGKIGYVTTKYIKKGRTIDNSYQTRDGAVCKDGSTSYATGRGACSHHGGVSYWTYETIERYEIIDD